MATITIDTTAGTVVVEGSIPYGHHVAPYRMKLAVRGEPMKVERLNSGTFDADDMAAVWNDVLLELTPILLSERARVEELEVEFHALDDAPPDSEPANPMMAVVEEIVAKVDTCDRSMRGRQALREEARAANSKDLAKRRAGLVAIGAENICQLLGLDKVIEAIEGEPDDETIANPRGVGEALAIEANCMSFLADEIEDEVEANVKRRAVTSVARGEE